MLAVLNAKVINELPPSLVVKWLTRNAKKGIEKNDGTSYPLSGQKPSMLAKKSFLLLKANICFTEALDDETYYNDIVEVLINHIKDVKIKNGDVKIVAM